MVPHLLDFLWEKAKDDEKLKDIKVDQGISNEPYRSTLFFLKEAPIISKLIYGKSIDLLFINGHGICHPYLYGLATVIGLTHGIPTIQISPYICKKRYLDSQFLNL